MDEASFLEERQRSFQEPKHTVLTTQNSMLTVHVQDHILAS